MYTVVLVAPTTTIAIKFSIGKSKCLQFRNFSRIAVNQDGVGAVSTFLFVCNHRKRSVRVFFRSKHVNPTLWKRYRHLDKPYVSERLVCSVHVRECKFVPALRRRSRCYKRASRSRAPRCTSSTTAARRPATRRPSWSSLRRRLSPLTWRSSVCESSSKEWSTNASSRPTETSSTSSRGTDETPTTRKSTASSPQAVRRLRFFLRPAHRRCSKIFSVVWSDFSL